MKKILLFSFLSALMCSQICKKDSYALSMKDIVKDLYTGKPEEFIKMMNDTSFVHQLDALSKSKLFDNFKNQYHIESLSEEIVNDTSKVSLLINSRTFQFTILRVKGENKLLIPKIEFSELFWLESDIRLRIFEYYKKDLNYENAFYWLIPEIVPQDSKSNVEKLDNEQMKYFEKSGDKEGWIAILKTKALKGNIEAMIELGSHYNDFKSKIFGQNLPKDHTPTESLKWYLLAAQKNVPIAMWNVAFLYEEMEQNFEKAFEWHYKLLGFSSHSSLLKLSEFYKEGKGCPKDLLISEFYKNCAFRIGLIDTDMAFQIASSYEYGHNGFEINKQEAIKWYTESANLGNKAAKIYGRDLDSKRD